MKSIKTLSGRNYLSTLLSTSSDTNTEENQTTQKIDTHEIIAACRDMLWSLPSWCLVNSNKGSMTFLYSCPFCPWNRWVGIWSCIQRIISIHPKPCIGIWKTCILWAKDNRDSMDTWWQPAIVLGSSPIHRVLTLTLDTIAREPC